MCTTTTACFHELGLLKQAEHAYRHAIALDPEHCEAGFIINALVVQGNYTEGWQRYSGACAQCSSSIVDEIPGCPLDWTHRSPASELVLLHEQGR